ncbi:MAG: hypothetical protein ACRD6X_08575 [Pyrinomonadaceae bacterium]
MKSEAEITDKGMDILIANLGRSDAQRFINILANDRSDYTKWRKYLFHGMSLDDIHAEAQALWEKNHEKETVS